MRRVWALISIGAFLLSFFSSAAVAEGTRTWEQSSFDDFEKGTANGVAIRSDGALELAPNFRLLYNTPSTYIWAMDTDSEGNVYVAAGSPARVYRITPDGRAGIIFAPQELQVQALVVNASGVIYAATSPDGKVYRIEHKEPPTSKKKKGNKKDEEPEPAPTSQEDGLKAPQAPAAIDTSFSPAIVFNPETKYIWDLALDSQGNLFVATGDRGEIFKVSNSGEHALFFKSDEAHIRVLAFDHQGNLIAGSDGSGLVYRISPAGEAFVLYSAPKKEITALAVDAQGNIYAAGAGEKKSQAPSTAPTVQPIPIPVSPSSAAEKTLGSSIVIGPSSSPASSILSSSSVNTSGGSEVYKIAPDGSPLRVWSSHDDLVYALGFDHNGTLLAGTGNRGRIVAITGEDQYTDLLKASANQVTAFAKAPGGGLYASTSNFGKLFVLGPGASGEGSYDSDVFDAHIFSRWGRAEVRSRGNIDFFARSGNVDNPDRNWSPWEKVNLLQETSIGVPSARFVQWRAVLHDGSTATRLDSVVLNYLPKNVAPQIDDIAVQVGTRYSAGQKAPASDNVVSATVSTSGSGGSSRYDTSPSGVHDKDAVSVRWNAHDDNDDDMLYALYYRGDEDSRWLLLKKDIEDRFYTFDSSLLPDGGYIVKVVVSDAPSHSPHDALTSEKQSERFEVDTTPPVIEGLKAVADSDGFHLSFVAADGFSPIKRAEYSVDAQPWQYVQPVDQISDSKSESYNFTVLLPGEREVEISASTVAAKSRKNKTQAPPAAALNQEHVIVVRAYDRFDNMSAAKVVVGSKNK
jgi:sugar lactone lactonase YvrE